MAKRKRKTGEGGGSKLKPIKDYREDQYVPYIHGAETGIVGVWQKIPDLTDGDVRQALRTLVKTLERWDVASDETITLSDTDQLSLKGNDKIEALQVGITLGLNQRFQELGPLTKEDTIGVLKQINYSIGNMNFGLRQQNYLHYVRDFLNAGQGKDPTFWTDIYDSMNRLGR